MMETAGKPRLAIVVSSFNRSVTDALLEGAREAVDTTAARAPPDVQAAGPSVGARQNSQPMRTMP